MSDEFRDYVDPIQGKHGIDPLSPHGREPDAQPGPRTRSIKGLIIAVHRGNRPAPGQHMIDISIGGDEHTEIVIRVPPGVYDHLEGKDVVLYLEE